MFAGCGWVAGWAQAGPDVEKLQARAELSDLDAQNALGNAYNEGQAGLKQDYAEALKWYRRAAEKGFAPAQYNLGLAYEQGHGVAADEQQAFKYYLQAAEQGFGVAQFNVGNMYAAGRGIGRDLFEANLWFKQAAEKGVAEAQFNLGLAYETGRGVKKDEVQAARWYKQAADRGFSRAQHNLGLLLEDGRGVPKNDATAAEYYRAAAEQGFGAAQNNYGIMLLEGRGGLARDPVQAWVWLSLAVENGASPNARDVADQRLDAGQRVAATRLLAERRPGKKPAAASVAPAPPGVPPEQAAPPARAAELTAALEQAREANTQFAEANQRLELEKAHLEQQLTQSGDAGKLIEQSRAQSQRLAAQVQALTADKVAAEREMELLKIRVKDAQEDLARAKAAPAAPPGDISRKEKQIAELTAKLDQAAGSLSQLQAANQKLTEGNARLQQEKEALAAQTGARATAGGGDQAAIIANLQRDNARLNDEVKRSTIELLSLNSQLRSLRQQAAKPAPAAPDTAAAQHIAELTARAEQAAQETARWQSENTRLAARVAGLENQPKPVTDNSTAIKLAEAQQVAVQLQQQVAGLQTEKADLEKWSRSLEQSLNEKSAQAEGAGSTLAELRQKFGQVQKQFDEITAENHTLATRAAQAEQSLAARIANQPDPTELDSLRQQLATTQQRAEGLAQNNRSLADRAAAEHRSLIQAETRVAGLERELGEARKSAGNTAELEDLKNQLIISKQLLEKNGTTVAALREENGRLAKAAEQKPAVNPAELTELKQHLVEVNQALENSAATVAELTGANDRLQKELAAARQDSAGTGALREELTRLRSEVAGAAALREQNTRLVKAAEETTALRARHEQLTHDSEQLAASLAGSRHDLDSAQARVAELEKQLTDATTVRTRSGDSARKLQTELADANATVEKLSATVAELTGANDRLERDLENARKSTAAALAAQSQAVSAAQPDAYKMEIGTLQSQVKALETQIEEERNSSAKEVSTLAAQLARTRETNKSLTDANRALLNARQAEAPAANQQEFEQLQAKVRELGAAGDELRRQNEKLTSDSQNLRGELIGEKSALQERLEAVGAQLVKTQQEVDTLQKQNAEAMAQVAASQLTTEQAKADLLALQGRTTDAEKASESQSVTVAELTQANAKLELGREDMQRLVESYRADISRLTQNVRSAEQQRTAAERGAQQNVDAVTAQLAQLRRDLENTRTAQARQAEAGALQDRDRVAVITQLRTENGALAARLSQAQGTLDQIASAARLGTPAATIASGGLAPVRPVVASPLGAPEVRFHTVTEGDSLSRISMRYYGTPNRWQEIYNANRDVLQGSSVLRVGMQLRIP